MRPSSQPPCVGSLWGITKALALLALVTWSSGAAAQTIPDGQMAGVVRDATGGVLAGARVAVRSPQLIGGAVELMTTAEGSWRAPALPPGTYEVRISAEGFRPARLGPFVLAAGQTLTADVELELAGIVATEHVDVVGPLVDVRSAAVVAGIGAGFLRELPTSRSIADLINLVPGIAGDMAYGGTKFSNGLYVDGVDTTEPGEQGPWLRYNQNWLQEVQVVGLGAGAEHGKSTGAAAHAIVRSGGDRYSGLAEYWTTQSGWLANNTQRLSEQLQRSFAPRRIGAYWTANGQLGGPLRQERVWFFGGLEHIRHDHAPAGYDGPVFQEEEDTRAIGKVTAAATDAWRLEGFLEGGRRRVLHAGIGRLVAPEATTRRRQPQASWSSRAFGRLRPDVLLDLRYAGYTSPAISEAASSDGPPGHYDLLTGLLSVNALTTGRTDRIRHQVSAAGTFHAGGPSGKHELKFGLESAWARERTTFDYPGGVIYYDLNSEPYLRQILTPAVAVGETRHHALFVQERWQMNERVTLLPGLRLDWFRGSTPQAEGVLRTNPISPRLGVAWDPFGNRRTVLRVHYGRYTDQVFAQPVLLTDSAQPGGSIMEALNAAGEWEEISRFTPAGLRRIGSDVKHSHVDQIVVGLERQFLRNVALQTQFIHRAFGNFMGFVHDSPIWAPVERRDPGPDGLADTADDGPLLTVYNLENASSVTYVYTNPDQAWRRYSAWQVVASRRHADDWQFQASYTWARTRGTIGTGFHTNAGRGELGQGNGGNPNRLVNADGRSPHDPTHEAKLIGFWRPRWFPGVNIGGVYRYTSGAAWARTFVARGLRQGTEQILAEPRGARRVDAVNNLDLRVEVGAPLRDGRRLGVFADVFNVTNQGAPDSDWVVPVFTGSGPSLGLPAVWRQPRQLRLSVRLTY